jgi:hypothetical protein
MSPPVTGGDGVSEPPNWAYAAQVVPSTISNAVIMRIVGSSSLNAVSLQNRKAAFAQPRAVALQAGEDHHRIARHAAAKPADIRAAGSLFGRRRHLGPSIRRLQADAQSGDSKKRKSDCQAHPIPPSFARLRPILGSAVDVDAHADRLGKAGDKRAAPLAGTAFAM